VLLLAFAPVAFFFSAPYTESLFLVLSVGAFLAARTGRWALAGLAAGAASGTRSTGALLLLPLLILYLYGPRADRESPPARPGWRTLIPRHPVRPDILWLALAPVGIVAFSLYLRESTGDALAWAHFQPLFGRRAIEWPTEPVARAAEVAAPPAASGLPADHVARQLDRAARDHARRHRRFGGGAGGADGRLRQLAAVCLRTGPKPRRGGWRLPPRARGSGRRACPGWS